jgi:hypothetical protein
MMNENRIITWEEAEQIMSDAGPRIVKCSLPEQARPTEPDNETDVESSIRKLADNDPKLKEINLNNMKVLNNRGGGTWGRYRGYKMYLTARG